MAAALFSVENLAVTFPGQNGAARAVRGLDLDVAVGEVHGIVGESGSGKTVTMHASLGLLGHTTAEITGSARLAGQELIDLDEGTLRTIRGARVGMVFQEPARYLNPAFTIGNQISEMLRIHKRLTRTQAKERAGELLAMVGMSDAKRVVSSYSHELSGGMRQRAMIAMAVSCGPDLLIADEPTTALDVTVERKILELLLDLKQRFSMSLVFVSHDLAVVQEISDNVTVMYLGRLAEQGPANEVLHSPRHPYTRLLIQAIPHPKHRGTPLATIPGRVPDATSIPAGCAFHSRCPHARDICRNEVPVATETTPGHVAACHLVEELA